MNVLNIKFIINIFFIKTKQKMVKEQKTWGKTTEKLHQNYTKNV